MSSFPNLPLRLNKFSAIAVVALTLGIAGCGGGSDVTTPPVAPSAVAPPDLVAATNTGSKVLSWFGRVANSLYDVAVGVAAIAGGNVTAGVGKFAAAGLGIISKGLDSGESGDDQAKQLSEIDSKLDTVIVDVQSIATQVSTIEGKVDNMIAYQKYALAMSSPMATAQTWLDSYYTNPAQTAQSREWVRWYMAGCDLSQVGSCPSASKPASAANLALFRQTYMKNPDLTNMTRSTDNFPRWWAFSVIGDQTTGASKYDVYGTKADDIVTLIYHGLTDDMGQDTNGLISYMNYFMTQGSGHCGTDVTDKRCDLYNNVYLPLETYFSLAIGRQTQLVMALAEAYTVLAQEDQASYGRAGDTLMAGFNKKLAVEVEAFLQAAEQIALYRAADGRTDWSNFAATDAGKLLARADFVAAQIAGKNYRTSSTTPAWTAGYVNPPWPSNGIVGRVFYADGEQLLTTTATRSVCSNANPQSCTNALTHIGENTASQRPVSGVPPYLLWKRTVDAKGAVTLMTGTAKTRWTVQRLMPVAADTLPVGASYLVDSTKPRARMPAKLDFYNYDENFARPPGHGTSSVIPFGSFSSVEGAIGRYGLMLDTASFKGSANMDATLYDDSYKASTVEPGAVSYNVTYLPNKQFDSNNPTKWGGSDKAGTWSASSLAFKLDFHLASATSVKIRWPSSFKVGLNSQSQSIQNQFGKPKPEYYSYVKFKQTILDGNGKELKASSECPSAPFVSCYLDESLLVEWTGLKANATNLSFAAHFSTEVDQYDHGINATTVRTGNGDAKLLIKAPLLTLIR